ncbi:MAG: polysaccharide deacetylase family protein [Chloroflexota bacterium]
MKLLCITIDIEADYANTQGHTRLFEEPALFERYVDLIRRTGVKVTGFLVTSILSRYGDGIRKLEREIPIEFALHSHHHNTETSGDRAEIELAQKTFREFFGKEAIGYRAPIGAISREGIGHLMDLGFRYDASVFASIRPGKNGYWNTHMPIEPFRVTRGSDSLLEFPFPALPTIRLNFGLPWIKLYGLGLSAALMRLFPPPSVIAFTTHAHDLYAPHLSDGVTALERRALLRNSERGFDILETMIERFREAGYEFAFMSEICDHVDSLSNLPSMPLDEWRYFLFKDFPWRQNSNRTSKNTPNSPSASV